MLKHRVFLVRNWERVKEKQELLKREGEVGLSQCSRWGSVMRDDGNIKSGALVRLRLRRRAPARPGRVLLAC